MTIHRDSDSAHPLLSSLDSAILWEGQSELTGEPVMAIATGLRGGSDNPKTGPMIQIWVLRSDIPPMEAVQQGKDKAVCGDCRLRGEYDEMSGRHGVGRACYVVVNNAPRAIYAKYATGGYHHMPAEVLALLARERGLSIRLGAYGDPGALPLWLVRELCSFGDHTGYTHSWRMRPDLAPYVMASADSVGDHEEARGRGWRVFRTRGAADPLLEGEVMCPASEEAGHRTTCEQCTLCDGKQRGDADRRRHVAIIVHGSGAVHALRLMTREQASA